MKLKFHDLLNSQLDKSPERQDFCAKVFCQDVVG